MSKIAVFCADGVEEVECLTTVDFCRRADIDVEMVSVTGRRQIIGGHHIRFTVDSVFEDVDFSGFDGVVLPGGAGTSALASDEEVKELTKRFYEEGKLGAAICAAPEILANLGILQGKKATGYPGFRPEGKALWTENKAERDGNVITGKGPGATPYFALEIIRYLAGEDMMRQIAVSTMLAEA